MGIPVPGRALGARREEAQVLGKFDFVAAWQGDGEDTGLVPTVSGNEGLEDLIPVAVFCVRPLAIGGAENVLMNKEEK